MVTIPPQRCVGSGPTANKNGGFVVLLGRLSYHCQGALPWCAEGYMLAGLIDRSMIWNLCLICPDERFRRKCLSQSDMLMWQWLSSCASHDYSSFFLEFIPSSFFLTLLCCPRPSPRSHLSASDVSQARSHGCFPSGTGLMTSSCLPQPGILSQPQSYTPSLLGHYKCSLN